MNKTKLIEQIANKSKTSKITSMRILNAMINIITKTLKKGESITLIGFGTFSIVKRAMRSGRNPRTGEKIKIKSTKIPKFKPGKNLKNTVK